MDVVHEKLAAVLLRPGVAQVDHGAGVGMAAAGGVGASAVGLVPLVADPVAVTGDGLDVGVSVWLVVVPRLPLVATTLADVEQVRDDAAGQEGIAVIVEVDAPRVAGPVGEDL